jgi:hypothetical protein
MYIYKNNFEIIYSKNSFFKEKFNTLDQEKENTPKERKKLNKISKEEIKENRKNEIQDENKIEQEIKKDDNETLLTFECKKGNIEKVKELIEKGEDINIKNKYGDTPLIIACKNGNIELAECLLRNEKIDVNMKSDYGMSPLLIACYFKNKDLVDCLLKHKAIVDISVNQNSPYHVSCYLNSIGIVKSLVKKENLHSYSEKPNNKSITINDEIFRKSSKLIPIKSRKPSKLIPIKPICLIENDEGSGSGFFIEIPIPLKKKPIRGLMTNNHVLNENYLKEGKSFNISISNGSKHTIEINGNDFIFTSELIDITFIELNEENIKKINPHFLKPNNENGNIKDANTSDSILIIQYPQKKLSFARGNIRKRRSFDYYHEVSTNEGSSGSPLLNKNNYVVGIHKSSIITDQYDIDSKDNVNVAVKISEVIYAIRMLYNNESFYEIKIARKSPRKLTEMEIKELEEYGIVPFEGKDKMDKSETSKYEKKILEKSLFQCNKFGN